MAQKVSFLFALLALLPAGCHSPAPETGPMAHYDVLIRHGHILDGTGNPWYAADIAIRGDRIAAIGPLEGAQAKRVIDASGLVVSPGFIDMLGQSEESLLIDHRSQSKLSQGITSEITGEGGSIAPQNELTLAPQKILLDHYHLSVDWHDLAGYFHRLRVPAHRLIWGRTSVQPRCVRQSWGT
jgi:dihydroorotase/N-acyl-D-amino-acid deacylase